MANEPSDQRGRPPVWRMVKEAVEALGGRTTNVAVRDWILKKYPDTNAGTIRDQILLCTVNHASRIHYDCNKKPRKADSQYDFLFRPATGQLQWYDPARHGQWEIRKLPDGKLCVAAAGQPPQQSVTGASASDTAIAEREVAADKGPKQLKASSEKEWVIGLAPRLESALQAVSLRDAKVRVVPHRRLPYTREVLTYQGEEPEATHSHTYETDLLIYDQQEGDAWVPRVIIECKTESVTTHDALTYSAKAATHKQVHPYLRYGILIGSWGDTAFPARLFRHGAYFDFMATWNGYEPADEEWHGLVDTLIAEIRASRKVQQMLSRRSASTGSRLKLVHRPLQFR